MCARRNLGNLSVRIGNAHLVDDNANNEDLESGKDSNRTAISGCAIMAQGPMNMTRRRQTAHDMWGTSHEMLWANPKSCNEYML